jgi:hypothetical protein
MAGVETFLKEDVTMKRNYVFLFVMVFMLLSGCASVPTKDIQVDAQADPKASFTGYRTYAWLGSAAIVNDAYGQWEPPAFDPDLIVAFATGVNMDALGLKVDPETKMDMLSNVPQGGLLIVLLDSDSGFVVWVGVATAEIQESPDAQTVKARLDYAVTQLLKKLPE